MDYKQIKKKLNLQLNFLYFILSYLFYFIYYYFKENLKSFQTFIKLKSLVDQETLLDKRVKYLYKHIKVYQFIKHFKNYYNENK